MSASGSACSSSKTGNSSCSSVRVRTARGRGAFPNDVFEEADKHYVTVWMLSDWANGTERITEPDKYVAQAWHTFEDLPENLFLPWEQLKASEFYGLIKANIV